MNTTDDPRPEDEPVTPPEQAAVASDQPGMPGRVGGMARVAAPVVAALPVGGGVVFAVDHHSGSNASASSASAYDGRAASLSSVQVGDPVVVHVYPSSSGQMLVERLFAGSSASGGPGGFGAPPPSAGGGTQSSGSGT